MLQSSEFVLTPSAVNGYKSCDINRSRTHTTTQLYRNTNTMWLEFELSLQQLQHNTILFVAPPRCVRCVAPLQLPPENNDKIYESHINKKTVFPKKYKKKKRNNDNGKQTTNKPTTNRNVQQFILNRRRRCRRWRESKNHNKRTRLCV